MMRPPSREEDELTTPAGPGASGPRILAVTEATRVVATLVRSDDRLRDLWIEGEVGRVTISTAGHAYFTLKDDKSQLQCVWFRDDRLRSPFQPQTGLRVVTQGRMDLYEPQGALQFYVGSLQPSGVGDLAIQFEQLKARLSAEGLFDQARKRPLPSRPAVVAVITSPTGAVWKDICQVLGRRWPLASVLLVACKVQGEGSAQSILGAFRRLERHVEQLRHDDRAIEAPAVTILARGGGSMEDLWSFNDERVVRAIVSHPLPVISGIGHEVDVTLSDFAADLRAPTPSAAAELVVPNRTDFAASLGRGSERMRVAAARAIVEATRDVSGERRLLERLHPAARLAASRERAGELLDRGTRAVQGRIAEGRRVDERSAERLPALVGQRLTWSAGQLSTAAAALRSLGPEATLERGYAIVRRREDGAVVRDPIQARRGTALAIRVARGEFPAVAGASRDGPPVPDLAPVPALAPVPDLAPVPALAPVPDLARDG
ncbi:MAG: exodeoxyribonuclease VII large subunit [Chloroflexi bacterium]|nr:exodeoxyribonuclease VII large subunit [Chloroflexota bacterium]